jgi:hypothetical protein
MRSGSVCKFAASGVAALTASRKLLDRATKGDPPMASPFPGMDPYLEQFWGDVHQSLVTYARDQLQSVLPGDLRARVEERVFVESPEGQERSIYPDIRVVERGRKSKGGKPPAQSGVAVAEPLRIRLPDEPVTQGYIEIIDLTTGRRVVTVIEVLSPSNKLPGPGRKLYERKQQECRDGNVSLVEIDLLRSGPWVLAVPEYLVPASYRAPYRVCVFRRHDEALGEVYRVPLRERLPVINVPLREADADVRLDLQLLIDLCYRNGGYDDDVDYRGEPDPPLDSADARWADMLLRKQRKRTGAAAPKPARREKRQRKPDR